MKFDFYSIAVLLFAVVMTLAKSVFYVKEDHRLVLVKLGQVNKVNGPGLNFVAPYVNVPIIINLKKYLPGWTRFSESQIEEKLIALIRENPDPKFYH
ncbi:hypothetical protein [Reinekea sp.]|jgi:regulator of protease activity HflC (stomatin/prohibitin superfamily)|uniref:hypothetical protein n=1 Tax=Reinekea sp. TaxID=1970455 RepID=UPI0039890B3B